MTSFAAKAQSDLTLTVDGNIPTGTYHNITVVGPAVATIAGQVQVTGTFRLKFANNAGGAVRITDDANFIYGNHFQADSATSVVFSSTAGIDGTTAGAIRTMTKNFSTACDFTYTGTVVSPIGTLGNSFPDRVRNLTINRPTGVRMTHDVAVREVITMRNGILYTNGFVLTLISQAPDVPGLTAASTTVVNFGSVSGANRSFISGPARVQRYINPRFNAGVGYRHYSASVTGSTVNDLRATGFVPVVNPQYNTVPYETRFDAGMVVPYPNVFYYDQTQVNVTTPGATARTDFDRGWQSPSTLSDPLQVTKGYIARINSNVNVDFNGTLNQDETYLTPVLGNTNQADGGWHLIGNPYPAKVDWNLMPRTAGVLDQISQYRSTGPVEGFYSTYINGFGNTVTSGGFTVTGSPIIAQNQAFFVRVRQGQTGQVTFNDACRITNFQQDPTAPFFRSANTSTNRPVVRLNLANAANTTAYGSVVYFEQGATTGYDADKDAVHISGGFPLQMYSLAGAENVDINALPEISQVMDYTMPLHMVVSTAGTYTMSAAEVLNMPAGYQVLLQDAVTGTVQDLTLNPTYSFTTAANTNLDRFTVRFRAASVTGTVAEAATAAGLEVYPNPVKPGSSVNVMLAGLDRGRNVTVTLINQVGQRVWTKQYQAALGGLRQTISTEALTPGVYTLQVTAQGAAPLARRVVVE